MDLVTLLLLAVGLSMDAFAVSICKGLAMQRTTFGKCLIVGAWFGGFQGLMPFIGYILGIQFESYINAIAPWIAFVLLAFIGGDMIKEAISGEEEEESDTLKVNEMFLLAVATSIDALAVGITFACVPVAMFEEFNTFINTVLACLIIAVTTFVISVAGVNIGHVFGTKYKNKAEFAGGAILVLLGIKILLEHFGIL
ncbi:MAG: manganese efflux pump MntP family protein [Lachnospiraceae bacterium]